MVIAMTTEPLRRKPSRWQSAALRLWHAWIAGGFLVAWATGDEDTYFMHFFAGYAVLAAVVARLLAGLLAPRGGPLRLPRPSLSAARAWLFDGRGRNPGFAWLGVAVLVMVGLSAASGALADPLHRLEDLHEGLSEAALWPVFAHIAFILFVYGGIRRLVAQLRHWWPDRHAKETAS